MSSPKTYSHRPMKPGGGLPDAILDYLRKADTDNAPHPKNPRYVIEYGYPTVDRSGKAMETSLGFDYPDSVGAFPKKGAELKLHGTTFVVDAVDKVVEVIDGLTVNFCSVTVRLA